MKKRKNPKKRNDKALIAEVAIIVAVLELMRAVIELIAALLE